MTGQNIVIAILAVVVLGAGAWWYMDRQDVQSGTATEENQAVDTVDKNNNEAQSENFSGEGTFAELARFGEALECEFTFSEEEVSGSGVGFFADGMARVDSQVRQAGENYTANYIIRDDTMYMWSDTPQGQFAMQMAVDETDSEFSQGTDAPIDPDENVSYDCKAWSIDSSVFVVPEDIEFMDMGAMMQGFEGMDQSEMEAMMEMSQ